MSGDYAIEIADPASAASQALIAELDAYQAPMYPAESNHLDSLDELQKPNVCFLGAFSGGSLLACGAVKLLDNYGEIKRVYVPDQHRGRGIAKALMAALEQHAQRSGAKFARLETGIYQPEAIGLYEAIGYTRTEPFGDYVDDPMSVFMEKKLAGG